MKKPKISIKKTISDVLHYLEAVKRNDENNEPNNSYVVTDEQLSKTIRRALTKPNETFGCNPAYVDSAYLPINRLKLISKISIALAEIPRNYNNASYERKAVYWPSPNKTRGGFISYNWKTKILNFHEHPLSEEQTLIFNDIASEFKLKIEYSTSDWEL